MKAIDLINMDLEGKAVAIPLSDTSYVLHVDDAELVFPDEPNGEEYVKLTYQATELSEMGLADEGDEMLVAYLLHPDTTVEVVERTESGTGKPAENWLTEAYVYTDVDGDTLTVTEFTYPSDDSVAIDASSETIAVPREDLPRLLSEMLTRAGVHVCEKTLLEDEDTGELTLDAVVKVRDGSEHPAAIPANLSSECLLAEIAFLCSAYQVAQAAEAADEEVSYTLTDKGRAYLAALEERDEKIHELVAAYADDPDVDVEDLPEWIKDAWYRVLLRVEELYSA